MDQETSSTTGAAPVPTSDPAFPPGLPEEPIRGVEPGSLNGDPYGQQDTSVPVDLVEAGAYDVGPADPDLVGAPADAALGPLGAAEPLDDSVEDVYPVAPPVTYEVRPNWMLSFVCAWAGATSLSEAWALMGPGGFPLLMRNLAFFGYCSLGVGLFGFALEALRWGGRRRGAGRLLMIAVSAIATLLGVVCLVLSKDPGRRI